MQIVFEKWRDKEMDSPHEHQWNFVALQHLDISPVNPVSNF
jgi:hypothetical protein